MKILALNSGSSSIKFRIFDAEKNFELLAHEYAERVSNHRQALQDLIHDKLHINIDAVGHRVVHGGELFSYPLLINNQVIQGIKEQARFAPLHCEPNVIGIEVLQNLWPDIPHVAVFDTAAHANIPSKAFLYGLPLEYYEKYKIRKYGFHGINHQYVFRETAKILGKNISDVKTITCHLGNGCSLSAFKNGHSIDNSMGMTPLEGLVMGTRCGDLDPSIVLFLMDSLHMNPKDIAELLNKKSGLIGLCGKNDMRDIIAQANQGEKPSQITLEIFIYRIQKCIGAFTAALNGLDALVFTGGIGENSPFIRAKILENFFYLGAIADPVANEKNSKLFSSHQSKIALLTIPANEEKVIAQETLQIVTLNNT